MLNCKYCKLPFFPKTNRGSPQKYCSKKCKKLFEKLAFRYFVEQTQSGVLDIAKIKRRHFIEGGSDE